MARIRTLKIDFFKDEALHELSYAHRFLFQGLWLLADREGRLEDRPRLIKTEIFPYDNELEVSLMLDDLAKGSYIIRYEANGKRYIQVRNFLKHQRPNSREAASEIPPCHGFIPPKPSCASTSLHAQDQEEGKGREGKGKGTEGEILGGGFEKFWDSYPKKKSKGQAKRAWQRLKPTEQLRERILAALEQAKTSAEWAKDQGRYIPHPATWLNAEGWEDHHETAVKPSKSALDEWLEEASHG